MEYIEGTPLHGPLPVDQALKYAEQIRDALDAAHRSGIMHRDQVDTNPYEVAPDGRFLVRASLEHSSGALSPIVNWPTLLENGMPH